MPKREPGFYEPSSAEEVRIFDGGEDEMDDEGSRLPLLLVIALILVFAFGGVVWLAYTQGVQRERAREGTPRVITADKGPVRTAPENPGGATPYQGLKVYEQRAGADDETGAPAKAAADAAPALRQVAEPAKTALPPVEPEKPATREASAPPAQLVAPKPAPTKPAKTLPAQAIKPAAEAPKPVAEAPKPVTEKPKAVAPEAKPVEKIAAGGAWVLQIGAYKSEADANAAWKTYSHKHAAVAGFAPNILRVDLGEKGTWYRLRAGAYADKAAATAACDKLKADGAACFPAKG